MTHRLLGLVALLLVLPSAPPALAQTCTFSITPTTTIDFGNIDLTLNTTHSTSVTFSASCTGQNSRTVRICPSFDTGTGDTTTGVPRKLANGTNKLSFNLFQDSGYATVWGSYFWSFSPRPPTLDIRLPPPGPGTGTATIYAQISAGQTTLPALTYTSSFAGAQTRVSYAYTTVGNCAAIGSSNATQVPFTVTARNVATCRVTANDLNFGSVASLASNLDVNGSASVTCTNQTPYKVLLNHGLTGTGPTNRKMTLGANNVIYGLYRDAARSLAWGNTSGVNSLPGTGTGSAQSLTIYGRVPTQSLPPPGTYSDTIIMTVEY